MADRLLIVGASGRAAAASARRAGFEPIVIDLFADADTRRLADTIRCDFADYPHGFVDLARRVPPCPWMYTGGLENHPDVVAAISETRPLWGNGPDVLRLVRDPYWLAQRLGECGVSHPLVSQLPAHPPNWLRKPVRGTGGSGIRPAEPSDAPDDRFYFQERIDGQPRSVVFLAQGTDTVFEAEYLQLVGTSWLHARPFQYAGNVGPLAPEQSRQRVLTLINMAERLHQSAKFQGIWGFDFIESLVGPRMIEVNPRFPASAELALWSRGVLSLLTHADCFRSDHALAKRKYWLTWPCQIGKGIYYAAKPITFPASGPWDDSLARCTDVWRRPDYADIPEPGTVFEPGQPVLTIFAEAATEAECVVELKRRAAGLDQLFGIPTPREGEP